jgi:hypothetical protein
MKLTDEEQKEFDALAAETYAPELWSEDSLPLLRAAKLAFEQGRDFSYEEFQLNRDTEHGGSRSQDQRQDQEVRNEENE